MSILYLTRQVDTYACLSRQIVQVYIGVGTYM